VSVSLYLITRNTIMQDIFEPGATIVVHWEANPRSESPNAVKSNRTDNGKTKKIILVADSAKGVQPRPGEVWICRIENIGSPKAENRGAIFVRPVSRKIEYKFEGIWLDPVKAQLIAQVLQDPRRNLMLEGDQGVGKSTIARAIAKTLGWEYAKVSGGLIKKFIFMLGRYVPKAEEGGLSFQWADSKLVETLRLANANPRKIYLLMIDEFTRIDEDARDALLDIIEGSQRSLRLPTGEDIPVGSNVVFMGAGNVGDGFTIRREDAAAKDRWVIVKIKVMPQNEELAHVMRLYPNCPRAEMDAALTIVNTVRAARKDPKMRLSKIVSTRGAETIAMFLAGGFPLDLALETAVVNQYAGTAEDQTSEAGRVYTLISEELKKRK
ncbi:MAG: AAA family ATPase, partial [Cyanobacteria bacterium SZAS LIN-2]|nr:AAA family ATPase [Cyanobacteria bacterium SZAS LIN-2]